MIRGDDFDRFAQHLSAEILYRHLGSSDRAHAGDIRVDARHVLEHADFHDAVGNLFLSWRSEWRREQQRGGGRDNTRSLHRRLPNISLAGILSSVVRLVMPFFPQYRRSQIMEPYLLHFGAVWAPNSRERFYHHKPPRDLQPRQPFQATRPQARVTHLRPRRRLTESYGPRVGHPSRRR